MRYMKSDLTLILGCVLLLAGCSASSKKADDAGAEATPVPAEVTEAVNRTTSGVGRSRRVTVTGDESVSARGRADGFGVGRGDRIAS